MQSRSESILQLHNVALVCLVAAALFVSSIWSLVTTDLFLLKAFERPTIILQGEISLLQISSIADLSASITR